MLTNEFKEKIKKYADELKIDLSESQISQFYNYMIILLDWNEKMNLTAITEPEEVIVKHFVDSMTISKYIPNGTKLIDVGTGAGFPGIPLKIIRNDIEIVLLDSLQKRINFLNTVIEQLELKNIEAVHARVEEYAKNKKYREKYDIATSRAVANLATLSEYLLPLVKVGGQVISMKGSSIEEELKKANKAISILGGKINNVYNFELPFTDIGRSVVILDKISSTLGKYPRKAGMPSKEPLFFSL